MDLEDLIFWPGCVFCTKSLHLIQWFCFAYFVFCICTKLNNWHFTDCTKTSRNTKKLQFWVLKMTSKQRPYTWEEPSPCQTNSWCLTWWLTKCHHNDTCLTCLSIKSYNDTQSTLVADRITFQLLMYILTSDKRGTVHCTQSETTPTTYLHTSDTQWNNTRNLFNF